MWNSWKSRKADVLDHWIAFVENFDLSSTEFYTSVEASLKDKQVPGMEMSRIEFSEGSVLSDKRTYLRMVRERLVFDVCAAPFGKTFFFSCRFAELPAVVHLWQLLVLIGGLAFFGFASLALFGRVFGPIAVVLWPVAWIVFLVVAIYVMRNSVAMDLRDLDKSLIDTPVIGAIYEAWIRKETYYRHDTRLAYLKLVSDIVKRLAEEATAEKGLKLVEQFEQSPILGEIYKPVRPKPETVEALA